jgi:hypothetical protein
MGQIVTLEQALSPMAVAEPVELALARVRQLLLVAGLNSSD